MYERTKKYSSLKNGTLFPLPSSQPHPPPPPALIWSAAHSHRHPPRTAPSDLQIHLQHPSIIPHQICSSSSQNVAESLPLCNHHRRCLPGFPLSLTSFLLFSISFLFCGHKFWGYFGQVGFRKSSFIVGDWKENFQNLKWLKQYLVPQYMPNKNEGSFRPNFPLTSARWFDNQS